MPGLIQKLEEENRINSFMLKDKTPKEIQARKKACSDLQRVVAEPAMGQSDLDDINKKVNTIGYLKVYNVLHAYSL